MLLPDGTVAVHTDVREIGKRRRDDLSQRALSAAGVLLIQSEDERPLRIFVSAPILKIAVTTQSERPLQRIGTLRLCVPLKPTLESARRVGMIVAEITAVVSLLVLVVSLTLLRSLLVSLLPSLLLFFLF